MRIGVRLAALVMGLVGSSNVCATTVADSCTVTDYASAEVPIALPPDHAAAIASLSNHAPAGASSLEPAVTAARTYLGAWSQGHPGRNVVVVVATDGTPSSGSGSVAPLADVDFVIASLAANGIPTYVIGFGAPASDMDSMASAGHTASAIAVDLASADPGGAFQRALKKIQAEASCNAPASP